MLKKPTIYARRPIANTGIFRIEEMDLEFSNGATRKYQRIIGSERGAVLIVPMPDPESVLLIREYSAAMERYELAFPKGSVDAGETPLQAANREIQEETGFGARHLELVTSVTVAPGYLYHTTHIVLATALYPSRLEGDEPEPIEVIPWRLEAFEQLLSRDDFTEARSIAAFCLLRERARQRVTMP